MGSLIFRITPNFQEEFVLVNITRALIKIKNYYLRLKCVQFFSAELIGCDLCNYHGTCYLSNQDQTICECFQWYAGKHCQFNLRGKLFYCVTFHGK